MSRNTDQTAQLEVYLGQVPIFTGLSSVSLHTLACSSKIIQVEKGELIFIQSDPSEKCYIVRSGQVSILLESADGREMVINEMRTGDLFGEVGLLTDHTRSTSAVARTDCELLEISSRTFLAIIDAEPLLARRLLEITANRLRNSSAREGALAFLDAQARLARLLLQLDKEEPEKGYITISQGELAQRTGLTRQTVAKALGRWRRSGWLITGRGHILLLKRARFSQLEKEWLEG